MSFSGLTPEALIERSDSKNPATTCKGITTSGRPCRRGLASTPAQSPVPSPSKDTAGVVAILDEGTAAAYFCWQHKDQAEQLVAKLEQQRRTRILPLTKKSSIDTLVERLGVLDLDETVERQNKHRIPRSTGHSRVKKRDTLPQEWKNMHGPLMSVPEEVVKSEMPLEKYKSRNSVRTGERLGRSNVKASWSCCIRADDDYNDDGPPVRRRKTREMHSRPVREHENYHSSPARAHEQHRSEMQHQLAYVEEISPSRTSHHQTQQNNAMSRPPLRAPISSTSSPPHSQTSNFLRLIPSHLPPTTTSALLAELSKPISSADESGYIYIFWLTPESDASKPDDETASSLLDDDDNEFSPPSPHISKSRHKSTTSTSASALQRYASVSTRTQTRTILLKIGRASNVHRRLSQWTKQCGQNITLIRYYPQANTRNQTSSMQSRIPHVHKVERLIHIELSALRAREQGPCATCGREHREWFEVPANVQGVRAVDEVVRRWSGWATDAESTQTGAAQSNGTKGVSVQRRSVV